MKSFDIIGRVVDATLYCADCGPSDADPVFADSETDAPHHCEECGERIDENLTTDGVNYVRESIAAAIHAGREDSVALTEWLSLGVEWKVEERVRRRAHRNAVRARAYQYLPFGT